MRRQTVTPRELLLQTINDLVSDFVVYDRRYDNVLTSDLFYQTVGHEVSIEEVVMQFEKDLRAALREGRR